MSLLDFARGPGLYWSLLIMVGGILLRLTGALLLHRVRPLSKPRSTHTLWAGVRTVFTRSWLAPAFQQRAMVQLVTGYVMHIGLFVVLLLFIPHIEFIEGLTGLSWPGLPNDLITLAAAITLAVMLFLLIQRLTHPVLRLISTPDDYLSWLVTFLPLVTGVMVYGHLWFRYETLLALHILSVELLFIWLPFGKLMHLFTFIPSRAQEGVKFERRGVRV
jgi:nitrate reductase gamma subunit